MLTRILASGRMRIIESQLTGSFFNRAAVFSPIAAIAGKLISAGSSARANETKPTSITIIKTGAGAQRHGAAIRQVLFPPNLNIKDARCATFALETRP